MNRSDSSLNEQFNQGYDEVVETIQQRAIWRVGERSIEIERFRCRCLHCRIDGPHQRVDVERHRLLFGRSVRQVEAARPMIRCERCGERQHTRDIAEFIVPTTMRLRDDLMTKLPTEPRADDLSAPLRAAIEAFTDEASPPLCLEVLQTVAASTERSDTFVREMGRALLLTDHQVTGVIATRG